MRNTRTRSLTVCTLIATIFASTLTASPAMAASTTTSPAEERNMRTAMSQADVEDSTQDRLIAKLHDGQRFDTEVHGRTPVSTKAEPLPNGGNSVTETFADGSQRTTSRVPVTTDSTGTPITTYTTISCNMVHCTALLSRAQTKQMASGQNAAKAILVALCGPAAWACAIAVGLMVDQANRALSAGKCVGIRKFVTAAPVWPISEPCRE